jgi:hypothetical protein
MMKPYGFNTRKIAEKLKSKLDADPERYKGIRIYYDHGESKKSNVCQPTTYMGRRYGADATLSGVDIVVVKDNNAVLVVEVEESTVRPKVIIGDIFGIVLADRIRIKRKSYSLKNATIVVAIAEEGKGKKSAKYIRLERHLARYLKNNPPRTPKKVRIIPCPISDLVRRIERLIRLEAGRCI